MHNIESQVPRRVSNSGFTHLFSIGFVEENTDDGKQRRTQSEDNSQ